MANSVGGLGGGAGSIEPQHQIQTDTQKGADVDTSQLEAKVNVLPGSGDVEGETGLDGVGGSIPRDNAHVQGEQDALHRTVNPDGPDEAAALGGSMLTVTVDSVEGQGAEDQGVVSETSASGCQTQIHPNGQVNVTTSDGTEHTGRLEDNGALVLDIQGTDEHSPVQLTFSEPPADNGEITVQVDALDGTDPLDVTIDVEDATVSEGSLRTERESDMEAKEKDPNQEPEWLTNLKALNDAIDLMHNWIKERMGKKGGN